MSTLKASVSGSERLAWHAKRKEKKRKDYTFRRQFNEKPSIIPGCPEAWHVLGLPLHSLAILTRNGLTTSRAVWWSSWRMVPP